MSNINLNEEDRLLLDKMIKANGSEDNTTKIQALKHSIPMEQDIRTYVQLRLKQEDLRQRNFDLFKTMCQNKCAFLFKNYTHIFNKLVNDELDLNILHKFIGVLREIESGSINQHEGSIKVGTILKELYIDSAIKSEAKHKKKEQDKLNRKGGKKKYAGNSIRQRNQAVKRETQNRKNEETKQKKRMALSWNDYKNSL